MGILGLTWDPAFLRTRAGMTMAVESGVGVLGAVISIVLGNGFESFLYWSTFFISGMFLFTHVTSLTQVLEAKIPSIAKIHLGYLAAWSVMLAIACIYRFIFWNFISVMLSEICDIFLLLFIIFICFIDFLLGSFGCFFD